MSASTVTITKADDPKPTATGATKTDDTKPDDTNATDDTTTTPAAKKSLTTAKAPQNTEPVSTLAANQVQVRAAAPQSPEAPAQQDTSAHWGVAHAGFQAEGGPGSPVDPNSDWYRWVPAWPPGVIRPDLASTFLTNEAKGHVAAYDAIHLWDRTAATAGQPAAFVGFTNNMLPARPANPVNPLDVQAADTWNAVYDRWFPNAVIDGLIDANLDGVQTPDEVHAEFAGKSDWMGVQYYGSQPMQGFGVAPIPGFGFLRRVVRKAVVGHRKWHRRRR